MKRPHSFGVQKNIKHWAKKSLGQNFLKSESILRKIAEAGEIKKDDVVLEIGPGKGALTRHLLDRAGLVIAVEKDDGLYETLKERFALEIKSRSLVLVHDDILNFQPSAYRLKPSAYKIIANIPYNITGAILKKFLAGEPQPESMVLMVQHEVAARILARDHKENLLSISVKAYGEPKMLAKVDKRYFSPRPKVNSAVIKISNISRKFFVENRVNEEKFWEIVKKGFAHKRKKLSGNLKNAISREKFSRTPRLLPLLDKRAEDLSLKDWIALATML